MEWKSQAQHSAAGGILALGLLAASTSVSAADSSGRLGVGISILPVCHISTHTFPGATSQAFPGVSIRCAKGAVYELEVIPPTLQTATAAGGITRVTVSF